MKFFKFLSIAAVLPMTTLAQAGEKGNGGIAYVCRDAKGAIVQAELLDLWEPLTYKVPRSDAAVSDQIEMAIDRITYRYRWTRDRLRGKTFEMKEKMMLVEDELELTDDAFPVRKPKKGCSYEQLANYTLVNDLGEPKLLVNREIYESPRFSNTDRAALFVHEAVYGEYRSGIQWANTENGPKASNSIISRQIVQAAFWKKYAVAFRADLTNELGWILRSPLPATEILTVTNGQLRFEAMAMASGACHFTTEIEGRANQKFSLEVSVDPTAVSRVEDYGKKIAKAMDASAYDRAERLIGELSYIAGGSFQVSNATIPGKDQASPVYLSWTCPKAISTTLSMSVDGKSIADYTYGNANAARAALRESGTSGSAVIVIFAK